MLCGDTEKLDPRLKERIKTVELDPRAVQYG